jgi:ABC-type multidrug transport system ATPase subunit
MEVSTKEPRPGRTQRCLEGLLLLASRTRSAGRRLFRRLTRKPRTVSEAPNLLPTLIKVFAGFARVDGELLEEEIDSSLSFLRYDYPDAVYSELRKLFRDALHEQQDLNAIATKLSTELSDERKILLGVQLYDLIAKAGLPQEQVIAYYSFMSQLGMAAQAIDIVYQLNANDQSDAGIYHQGASPLETVSFGAPEHCDVAVAGLHDQERIVAYRYHELLIVKNITGRNLIVQGRALRDGDLCRIFAGQRILIDDQVLTHQDLVSYFNAKKNVSLPQIFVAVNAEDEVRMEKNRSRDSCLEVTFGLRVRVTALADVDAVLNDVRLRKGVSVEATLEDNIIFHNDSELDLGDLRRRARQYGGRFQLKASKSEYLVSNNPGLLQEDDILLSPGTGGDVLLKISCDYDRKEGSVEVLQSDRPILVRGVPVRNLAPLADGDTIRIDAGQLLRCNFTERLLEEERNIVRSLEVRDLVCRFRNRQVALEGISFFAHRGEMVCVMGASGSGKSTLMRTLAGQFPPALGDVLFNGRSLYTHYESMRKYVAYVPQHDAFDEHLTIEENLNFAAALRTPHLTGRERQRRIDGKLAELGLNERRGYVVGTPDKKTLSGGERKRLNIGLDMISSADVYLFDEPTSGLSSKDSEHVIEIIRGMAHNKIVLVTIHQPTSKIFQMFQKAMLLDRGGKLVFFGTPQEMLKYFAEAEHQQQFGTELGGCEACGTTRPEFIFDVLETPLRDLSGDIIFEENNRGQLVPARRYSPDYWRDKYEAYHLMKDVQQASAPREAPAPLPPATRRKEPLRWREEGRQFLVLFKRAFFSKLRNNANLLITLLAAPALALLIGFVLRHSESTRYDFASAFHIPVYLFLSLVVAMFLGLTNSVDDITRDRPVLLRERNLNLRLGYYVTAKALTLAIFAFVQCVLFTLVGDALLAVRGMFWIIFALLFLTTMSGVAIGLVVSSLVNEAKTGVLIIPVVLIPQLILAGAFIKYEDMNRNMDFVYTVRQWWEQHPGSAMEPRSNLQVPLICQFMPMRWSYEAIIFAQAKLNPLTIRQERIQQQITELAALKTPSTAEDDRLEDLKELLALVSGLQAKDPRTLDNSFRDIDAVINGAPFNRKKFRNLGRGVTAEQLYVNQKVTDLVSKAEMEQTDYRNDIAGRRHLNVFFGPVKEYLGLRFDVIFFDVGILVITTLALFFVLYLILDHQVRTRSA